MGARDLLIDLLIAHLSYALAVLNKVGRQLTSKRRDMFTNVGSIGVCNPGYEAPSVEGAFVEVSVVVSIRQIAALEAAAQGRGLTTGQMLRTLIRDFTESHS